MGQNGRGIGQVTYFRILGLLIISCWIEATNAKFCSRIQGKQC